MAPPFAPHISLDLLRTLIVFSEVGRVEETARHLKLTQAAVSLQLKKLEAELKVPLFLSLGRKKVLTDEARDLVLSLKPLLHSLEKAFADSLSRKKEFKETVFRVACPGVLLRRCQELILHAGAIQIFSMNDEEAFKALKEDKIDLAVLSHRAQSDQISSRKLFSDSYVLVTHNQQDFIKNKKIDPAVLQRPCVSISESLPALQEFTEELGVKLSDVRPQYICPDWQGVLAWVKKYKAWAIVPQAEVLTGTKDLKVSPLEFLKETPYYAVFNKHFSIDKYLTTEM